MQGLGLRDKNGIELHAGDEVRMVSWQGLVLVDRVHYDQANACWLVGPVRICEMRRDKGTTLEVLGAMEGSKPVKSRRKGKVR